MIDTIARDSLAVRGVCVLEKLFRMFSCRVRLLVCSTNCPYGDVFFHCGLCDVVYTDRAIASSFELLVIIAMTLLFLTNMRVTLQSHLRQCVKCFLKSDRILIKSDHIHGNKYYLESKNFDAIALSIRIPGDLGLPTIWYTFVLWTSGSLACDTCLLITTLMG